MPLDPHPRADELVADIARHADALTAVAEELPSLPSADRLRVAQELHTRSVTGAACARTSREDAIGAAREALSLAEIGAMLGLTRGRVSDILRERELREAAHRDGRAR